jgi:hypothetical protein
LIKRKEKMKRSLAKVMMTLALGAIITMPGIASCKKSKSTSNGVISHQMYSGQNYPVVHTPLPSTCLLLGSGLAGLGLLGWRRKRKKP